jgi:hypothetical protein
LWRRSGHRAATRDLPATSRCIASLSLGMKYAYWPFVIGESPDSGPEQSFMRQAQAIA